MKKAIVSILIFSSMAIPSFAQKHMKHSAKNCPAKTCTDHSYDQAYSAPKGTMINGVEWVDESSNRKKCPAATCTDHSYDRAYSAGWSTESRTGNRSSTARRMNIPEAQPTQAWTPAPTTVPVKLRDDSYSMSNYTIYGRNSAAPNPYNGDDAPSYDGAAKNAYRNMRANNESAPLPPSTGE